MELRRNARGYRVVTMSERRQILDEMAANSMSPAEAARKYELAVWTVKRWLTLEAKSGQQSVTSIEGTSQEPTVPLSEYQRLKEELEKERAQLNATRKSLARMTVDRDILQEAVEIARKKKWI
jgi:transposase